jgi:hypothetical protein
MLTISGNRYNMSARQLNIIENNHEIVILNCSNENEPLGVRKIEKTEVYID